VVLVLIKEKLMELNWKFMLLLFLALSLGCLGSDGVDFSPEPVQQTSSPASTTTPVPLNEIITPSGGQAHLIPQTDDIFIERFKSSLESTGIELQSIDIVDNRPDGGSKVLRISYSTITSDNNRTLSEMWRVTSTYLINIKDGMNVDEMQVSITGLHGPIATYSIEKELTDKYRRDSMTAEKVFLNVMENLKVL
jgi:hypothetical protein